MIFRQNFVVLSALGLLLLTTVCRSAALPVPANWQALQDTPFNQGVDAYNRNQFALAVAKFQQVTGSRTQEAQQFIAKIKAYQEAISLAKGIMDRAPDEQDASSLAYAVQLYEQAVKIKADGPWDPSGQLAKAREAKAQFEKTHAEQSKARDAQFCAQALAAITEHQYRKAAEYSCPLANDNPGYSCGGDEAVHLCELNAEMAKLEKDNSGEGKTANSPLVSSGNPALDRARKAYEQNQFDTAHRLFQRLSGGARAEAEEYLEKIVRYNNSFANGERLARDGQYELARAAFAAAASIKADGPGDPQKRSVRMELLLGLDQFYSGDYASAISHLQDCTSTESAKQPLVRFYLGASELAQFFVKGGDDAALHQDALNDLKLAKQAGFKTAGQDVSPKILQIYNDLSF